MLDRTTNQDLNSVQKIPKQVREDVMLNLFQHLLKRSYNYSTRLINAI